jgi:hypothetical protein
MALTATATKGLEFDHYIQQDETIFIPGDPGDTLYEGFGLVSTVGEGVADILADNEGGMIGTANKTVVMSAATTAFPYPDNFDPAHDTSNSLVEVRPALKAGTRVYRVTFANQYDCTISAYTAATPSITLAASPGANDYYNGAIVYVYDGPGAGQVNVIADFDHATIVATLHRKFETALTAASKVIVLAGEAVASRGIGFFNRAEYKAAGYLTCDQGSDDGDYIVYLDWRRAAQLLSKLMITVCPARYECLA